MKHTIELSHHELAAIYVAVTDRVQKLKEWRGSFPPTHDLNDGLEREIAETIQLQSRLFDLLYRED